MSVVNILLVTNEDPGKPIEGLGEFITQIRNHFLELRVDVRVMLINYHIDSNYSD